MAELQRACRCGHTKSHELVAEEPEYTLWGWILLSIFGMTPKPDHVAYRCQICRQSLGSTRDPKILARKSAPKRGAPKVSKTPPDESASGAETAPNFEESSHT